MWRALDNSRIHILGGHSSHTVIHNPRLWLGAGKNQNRGSLSKSKRAPKRKEERMSYFFAIPRAPPIIPKIKPMIKPPSVKKMLIIEKINTSMPPITSFPGM